MNNINEKSKAIKNIYIFHKKKRNSYGLHATVKFIELLILATTCFAFPQLALINDSLVLK